MATFKVTESNWVTCPNCGGTGCGWCHEGKIVEVTVPFRVIDNQEAPAPDGKLEVGTERHDGDLHQVLSIQVITFACGICQRDYQVELHNGDLMMVACPHCDNASSQMVRGTP